MSQITTSFKVMTSLRALHISCPAYYDNASHDHEYICQHLLTFILNFTSLHHLVIDSDNHLPGPLTDMSTLLQNCPGLTVFKCDADVTEPLDPELKMRYYELMNYIEDNSLVNIFL